MSYDPSKLNIPKKHTLRYYMRMVGELYGEPKETLDEYIEEQVKANEHQLDKAIDCFRGMLTQEDIDKNLERVKARCQDEKK